MSKQEDKVAKYLGNTYSGGQLLREHKLDEYGFWKILGEDENCDFGGHHYEPDLGIFEGKLEDIVKYAVELPRFWSWGSGGRIKKTMSPQKIESGTSYLLNKLLVEETELMKRLCEIREEMKGL